MVKIRLFVYYFPTCLLIKRQMALSQISQVCHSFLIHVLVCSGWFEDLFTLTVLGSTAYLLNKGFFARELDHSNLG